MLFSYLCHCLVLDSNNLNVSLQMLKIIKCDDFMLLFCWSDKTRHLTTFVGHFIDQAINPVTTFHL